MAPPPSIEIGKKKFNLDTKNGMEYLIENNLLENKPKCVGRFLFYEKDLKTSEIGKYLGTKSVFNTQVLTHYLENHQFQNQQIDLALRSFLKNCHLPSETEKITRIIEAFAVRFHECNPGGFYNSDSCVRIAYAIMMLNRNLLNPLLKEKQTCEEFVSIASATQLGEVFLEDEELKEIYTRVKNDPLRYTLDDETVFRMSDLNNTRKRGWLWKQGASPFKGWKRRWFILDDGSLYYFKDDKTDSPIGFIQLKDVDVRVNNVNDKDNEYNFEIFSRKNENIKAYKYNSQGTECFEDSNRSIYQFRCDIEFEEIEWIKEIRLYCSSF